MHYFMNTTSPAVLEDLQDVISKGVSVLVQQPIGVVEHLASIVPDAKLGVVHFRFDVEGVSLVCVMQLLQQTLVRALWKSTLLIQEIKNT